MGHLFFIAEGLLEGVDALESELNNHQFGHGRLKLRPIRMYSLQYDSRDEEEVMNEFRTRFKEKKFHNTFNRKFRMEESPFKQGRLRRIIYWIVKLLGWAIGLEPIKPKKYIGSQKLKKPACNIFPVGKTEDNFVYLVATGETKEWL